jgi:hypothetical protein
MREYQQQFQHDVVEDVLGAPPPPCPPAAPPCPRARGLRSVGQSVVHRCNRSLGPLAGRANPFDPFGFNGPLWVRGSRQWTSRSR